MQEKLLPALFLPNYKNYNNEQNVVTYSEK